MSNPSYFSKKLLDYDVKKPSVKLKNKLRLLRKSRSSSKCARCLNSTVLKSCKSCLNPPLLCAKCYVVCKRCKLELCREHMVLCAKCKFQTCKKCGECKCSEQNEMNKENSIDSEQPSIISPSLIYDENTAIRIQQHIANIKKERSVVSEKSWIKPSRFTYDARAAKEINEHLSAKEIKETLSGKEIQETLSGKEIQETLSGKEIQETLSGKEIEETLSEKEIQESLSRKSYLKPPTFTFDISAAKDTPQCIGNDMKRCGKCKVYFDNGKLTICDICLNISYCNGCIRFCDCCKAVLCQEHPNCCRCGTIYCPNCSEDYDVEYDD